VVKVLGCAETSASFLVVGVHYVAAGVERREGLVDVGIESTGRAFVPKLAEALWQELPFMSQEPVSGGPAPGALEAAVALARQRVEEELAPVRQILRHRLQRDVERLHGYYRAMQEDMLRQGGRRAQEGAEREKLVARINAVGNELQRRLVDARERLRLLVTLRPAFAVRVTMAAAEIRVRLLRRKQQRDIACLCGGLQRSPALPLCEGCHAVVAASPVLCDDAVHLLCPACYWACPRCGGRNCLACSKVCGRCKAPYESVRPAPKQEPRPAAQPSAVPRSVVKPPAPPPGVPRAAPPARPRRAAAHGGPEPVEPARPRKRSAAPAEKHGPRDTPESRGRDAVARLARELARTLGDDEG
jgi:hypothetical protein